jgi:hypothetical protein
MLFVTSWALSPLAPPKHLSISSPLCYEYTVAVYPLYVSIERRLYHLPFQEAPCFEFT